MTAIDVDGVSVDSLSTDRVVLIGDLEAVEDLVLSYAADGEIPGEEMRELFHFWRNRCVERADLGLISPRANLTYLDLITHIDALVGIFE